MKYTLSIATIVLLLLLSAASGAALIALTSSNSSSSGDFSIDAPVVYGINEYTLVEIDEGDNDEEDVITERLFEFMFNAVSAGDSVSALQQQNPQSLTWCPLKAQHRTKVLSPSNTMGAASHVHCAILCKSVMSVYCLSELSMVQLSNKKSSSTIHSEPMSTALPSK